jgi:hypothetical protein
MVVLIMKYKQLLIITTICLVTTLGLINPWIVANTEYFTKHGFSGTYNRDVGGLAEIKGGINWHINRSLYYDFDQNSQIDATDSLLSALVPAIRSTEYGVLFPFYEVITDTPSNNYNFGTVSISDLSDRFIFTQTIAYLDLTLDIELIIFNNQSIAANYELSASSSLTDVELILYISPDFSFATFESGEVITDDNTSPMIIISADSNDRFIGITARHDFNWGLNHWGDGPGELNANDGLSRIINMIAENGVTQLTGDIDVSTVLKSPTMSSNEVLVGNFILSFADDVSKLYYPEETTLPTDATTTETTGTTTETTPETTETTDTQTPPTTTTPVDTTPTEDTDTEEPDSGFLNWYINSTVIALSVVYLLSVKRKSQ